MINMITPILKNSVVYNKRQTKNNVSFGTLARAVRDDKGYIVYRNDTRMFREDLNWNILMNYIERKKEPQKIYCYACSDGSEPYSIALALIKHFGTEKAQKYFPIIAKDVDSQMIKKAKDRKIDLDSKDIERVSKYQTPLPFSPNHIRQVFEKYWNGEEMPSPYTVDKKLAQCVDFSVGNIFDDAQKIDYNNSIIFFRNVWPYLKVKDSEKLLDAFSTKFTPSTSLVLGSFDELSEYPDYWNFSEKLQSKNFFKARPKIYERYIPGAKKMTLGNICKEIGDEFVNMALEKYEDLRSIF